jgi:hypothetical protein
MNDKAKFAVEILKQYALENQIPERSTSDLSPMEVWLILRLMTISKNSQTADKTQDGHIPLNSE